MTRPFNRSGTAQYPGSSPYIGQKEIYESLREFYSGSANEKLGTFTIFGDWGSGKTRLGHQLVSEAAGDSPGWLVQENGTFTNKPLFDEISYSVLPLWVRLQDCEGVTSSNAARKLILQAIEKFLENNGGPLDSIEQCFEDAGGLVPRLSEIINTGESAEERLQEALNHILDDTDIDRILVVVDEIEEAGSVGSQAPETEQEGGIDQDEIKAVFEGLKEALNQSETKYNQFYVDFCLLCTSGVRDHAPVSGGVKRRMEQEEITRPTIEEAKQYTQKVLEGEEESYPSDECVEALFFAAYNNYGWFTRAMHSMLFRMREAESNFSAVLDEYSASFEDLFDTNFTRDIEEDAQTIPAAEHVLDVLFKLHPVSNTELGFSKDDIDAVLDYTTPYGDYHPVGEVVAVEATSADVKRALNGEGLRVNEASDIQKYELGGDELDADRLADLLEIFSIDDSYIGLYADEENLRDIAEFSFGVGQVSESAVSTVVDALKSIQDDNRTKDEVYLAPSFTFLRQWNKQWRNQTSVVRWIDNETAWDEMREASRNVDGQALERRVAKGFLNTRFKQYEAESVNTEPASLTSDLVFKITLPEVDDVLSNDTAIALPVVDIDDVNNDLKAISRSYDGYPAIYLLFKSDRARKEHMPDLLDDHPSIRPFLIPHVVDNRNLARDFMIQMSFLGEKFVQEDLGSGNRDYIQSNRHEQLIQRDTDWWAKIDEDGWVLKPVLPDRYQNHLNAYTEAIQEAARGNNPQSSEDQATAIDYVHENRDVTAFISPNDGELGLPPFIPRVLSIIEEKGRSKPSELVDRMHTPADTTPNTVAERLCTLLAKLNLLSEPTNGEYQANTAQNLNALLNKVDTKVPKSKSEFSDFTIELTDTILIDLRIDDNRLGDYSDELSSAMDEIGEDWFNTLTETAADVDKWYNIALEIDGIVNTAHRGYNPQHELTDFDSLNASQMSDRYHSLQDDKAHEKYSIQYKIEFLKLLDEVFDESQSKALNQLEDVRESLNNSYSQCRGRNFPVSEVESILDDIEADLTIEDYSLHEALLSDADDSEPTNRSIYSHLNDQEFEALFNRLSWYVAVLSGTSDGFWKDFKDVHAKCETLISGFNSFSSDWSEANDYFETNVAFSNFLTDEEIPLLDAESRPDKESLIEEAERVQDLYDGWDKVEKNAAEPEYDVVKSVVDEPEGMLSGRPPSDLLNRIKTLQLKLEMLQYHVDLIQQFAEHEIEILRDELEQEWGPLKHASEKLDKEIGLDKTIDSDTYNSTVENIRATISEVDVEGKRLLDKELDNGNHLWDPLKKAYKKSKEESGILNGSDINKSQLQELENAGLLQTEVRYRISLT